MEGSYCHGIDNINDAWISGMLQTQFRGLLTAQQQIGAHHPINGRPALQSNCQQNNYNGYPPAVLHEQLKTYNQQNQITRSCMVQPHNIHRLQHGQPHFHRQNLHGLMPTMSASETIFGIPPTFALHSLQELSSAVTAQSKPVKSSNPKEHPFYWRRLHSSAPVEGMTRTKDKYRVVYTEKQRTGLEKAFKEHKFITTKQRAQLTKELDLSERQIKIWFQNRRAKERRGGTKQKTSQREEDPSYGKIEDSDNIALLSCRYSNEVTEPDFSQCRFQGSPIAGEVENFRDIGYRNQTPSSGHFRHLNTPTGWTTSSGDNMMTSLNISPLTSTTDLVTYQRS